MVLEEDVKSGISSVHWPRYPAGDGIRRAENRRGIMRKSIQ